MKKKSVVVLCSVLGVLLVLGVVIGLGVTLPVAPELDNSQSNNVVAEIYIENKTVPYMKVSRADFEKLFSYRGDNIFKNDIYLQSVDIRIEILDNIKVGETELALYVGAGKEIELNGNGYAIVGNRSNDPIFRFRSLSRGGDFEINDLRLKNEKASCFSAYNEVTLDVNRCIFEAPNHKAAVLTDSCVVNLNDGTYLSGVMGIYSESSQKNSVNVAAEAAIFGSESAVHIKNGNSFEMNIHGVVKTLFPNGACISILNALGDINISVDGGYLRGDIVSSTTANLNFSTGKLYGSIVSDTVTVNVGEDFIIEPYEAETTEVA